jgi:RND family efflux transporter MFP subunit
MCFKKLLPIAVLLISSSIHAQEVQDVATFEAQYQVVPRIQIFDGTVEAVNEATVSAQTSGRITEVFYDVDDFVEKGSLIVQFDDTEQKARLEKASAGLVEAEARYSEAQTEFERIKDIYAQKLVSKSDYDRAQASFKAARAKLNAARAAKDEAQVQYDYTQIRAPYSGIVTERMAEVGEVANVGTPIMTGISLDLLRVSSSIPQQVINAVRQYQAAEIRMADSNQWVPASDITLFPYADARTNTFKVRTYLPEGTQGLFPGMFVKVAFMVGEESKLLIPASSVVYRSELTGVYVVRADQSIVMRQVRLGRETTDGSIEVLSGLNAGDLIATDPQQAILVIKQQRPAPEESINE